MYDDPVSRALAVIRQHYDDGGDVEPLMSRIMEDVGDRAIRDKRVLEPEAVLKPGPEQSVWEKISSKFMGDRPSPERRRFVEGVGNIADVAHMGAYATPLAPYVGAADFARGVASGDPMEAVLGATGLPGRAAKAAGVAASAMMPGEAEAGPLSNALKAIRAYHGSPHKFDKFDISKIGTGEGAQAYGHGLYFAENPATAQEYRSRLAGRPEIKSLNIAGHRVGPFNSFDYSPKGSSNYENLRSSLFEDMLINEDALVADPKNAQKLAADILQRKIKDMHQEWPEAIPEAQKLLSDINRPGGVGLRMGETPGAMYEVDIHADPSHMLDWDKPLSEQKAILDKIYENLGGNNKVKELNNEYENLIDMPPAKRPQQSSDEYKFLESRYNELQHHPAVKLYETLSNNPDVSGKNFYYRFGGQDPEQASIKLKNVGIPGIKYLDQGSRGSGEGTSNYVVFDPNLIEILRRYKDGGSVERVEAASGGPMTKFLMEMAEKYRPHYDPTARIKGVPHPEGKWLSGVGLSRPIEEMTVTSQGHRPMVAEQFSMPEDYAGKALITGLGDRTPAGYEVTGINDRILNRPTDMRGGMGFGRDISSQGPDQAVWGSALSRARAIANKAKAATKKDLEPVFTFVAQGPEGGDFSHHMQDLVLGQLDQARMDPKLAEFLDKRMREAQTGSGATFAPKPDWVGIQSPEMESRIAQKADERVKMIKLMDAARFRDAPGFADVGASRFASTDPSLMFDPSFSAGKSFMSMDPTGRIVKDPVNPHPSYDTFIPAAPGKHGYLGRLEYELPPEVHFKHYLENEIKPSLRGKPLSKQTMSLLRQHPTVEATPEWVDMASEWQELMRRLYGSRRP